MDLEILEALALSDDRAGALAQLLPGSEDHDYYRCLHAQHANQLAAADEILRTWPERHGHSERYERLRIRQQLYRLGDDPAAVADDVRDRFGVGHWHEAEVAEVDPSRPTALAAGAFDGAALLRQAIDADANLGQVTDEGIYECLDRELDAARSRVLLGRLSHTAQPELVSLVADDLAARGSGGFGSLPIHGQLTFDQLHAVATKRNDLRTHAAWIGAVIRRMRPPASIDLELDRDAREAYLRALWSFVSALPPASNGLKAHVLWHLLDAGRQRGDDPDPRLFAAYLQLPRSAGYLPRGWIDKIRRDEIAELGHDFREITALAPAGDDEELVRDLLHRQIDRAEQFAQWLDRKWLDGEIATARLLYGGRDPERATLTLGPARAAALRERVDLAWCLHDPTRFGTDEPVVLEADVKNVPELVVKVFRVDPLAYFQHHHREVNTDLDLDGLAASHEIVLALAEPPVRRVRRRIELPMCARAGTYVIDLIGNGMSSRAVIYKGRLRHVARTGAAGHVVTILDEAGRPRPDARAWIGDREYVPDDKGSFAVPFSTNPGFTPMLLSCGDIASVRTLELQRESYALTAQILLDRESLTAGRTARAIARVKLTVGGAATSLALIKRASWDVTLSDRSGVATTKSQPLALSDDDAAVLEFPVGDDTAHVGLTIRGAVDVISEQREQELADSMACPIASMHGGTTIEALYLARTGAGWVLHALGKTGEPRAQRPVNVGLVHRWARTQQNVELATDDRGRIVLGELPGVARITATLGALTQTWSFESRPIGAGIAVPVGRDVLVPVPPHRSAVEVMRRMSLVEVRAGVPVRHPDLDLERAEDAIAIRGLPAGDYRLRAPGLAELPIAVVADAAEVAGNLVTAGEVCELSRQAPAIASIDVDGALTVRIRGATARTRVHAIATRFQLAPVSYAFLGPLRSPIRRTDRSRGTIYMSGRDIGDEYRYILERRGAKRFPNLLVDKPSLLLNPWSRRTTTTDVAVARGGGAFGAAPAPAMASTGYASDMRTRGGAGIDDSFASYDFVPEPPVVIANLAVGADGVVGIPLARLGRAWSVTVFCDDPASLMWRQVALAESPLDARDLRLALALDPDRHAMQHKAIAPLAPGERLVIDDLATAKVHLVDSVERAYTYLLALRDDPTLREFGFVTRWHALGEPERRERYSKYACHELHLFLYFKDRPWFDAVVAPYLAHKRTKTFVDHWLLGADLARYLEPCELARLNAAERALLAQRVDAGDALARLLADDVATAPPDPALDTRLIDALLGASTLDGDRGIEDAKQGARERAADITRTLMTAVPAGRAAAGPADIAKTKAAPKPAKKMAKRDEAADRLASLDDDYLDTDAERRSAEKPMYRAADKTQEWAENNWWHLTPAQSNTDLIAPNRLWRDLAAHRGGPFLSPGLGLATGSFAEAMCALAVSDLPFAAGAHAITADGPRLTIAAASRALAGSSQLVEGELVASGPPLVVGMSYVRTDDRHDWVNGEQVDKYVTGSFATGVVYTCQVVLANPTSSRQRIQALLQIPRGAIAVAGGKPTHTIDVALEPYATHGHEYAFYFPAPGAWSHFPVHLSRTNAIVAAAAGRPTLDVVARGAGPDPRSWAYVSQRGSLAEVVALLATANLAAIDLERCAWRLRDRAAYDAILDALERRRAYHPALWGYALYHRDRARIRTWLRALGDQLAAAGPVLDMPIAELDAEQLGGYEHLELSPLINARAHRLGPKLRILNDGLAAQYGRFLDLVAHRRAPTARDLLATAGYLLAQDRVEPALAALARVTAVDERMQHDYLAAYAACLAGELQRARELATHWRDLPVDRWRRRFEALIAMLDELGGAAPAVVDPRSREQQHADLAAKQPAFDLAVDRDGVVIRHQHVAALELRFFEMDVELLFSRQPFVQSDVSRFSFIEPGHREQLVEPPAEHRVAWPAALRGKNVVVEAVGAGQRKAKVHYANDLATNLAHQYGQIRVQRASDQQPLAATYVKVYARKHGGAVQFYKDGYTDLRGWFDYATLSTSDLDSVERFAILVCSDRSGAAIFEAGPPAR